MVLRTRRFIRVRRGQVLALDFLRVALARIGLFRSEVTRVCAPIIGMIANWLRVFRRADASRMGQGRRQQRHTQAVPPEKCGGLRGRAGASMRVSAACLSPMRSFCPPRAWSTFLPRLPEVRSMGKTRNQFN